MSKVLDRVHTATPWRVTRHRLGCFEIEGPNGEDLCYVNESDGLDDPEMYPAEANAALIITAVNHHDALVTVCRELVKWADFAPDRQDLTAIMATMRDVVRSASGDADRNASDPHAPVTCSRCRTALKKLKKTPSGSPEDGR